MRHDSGIRYLQHGFWWLLFCWHLQNQVDLRNYAQISFQILVARAKQPQTWSLRGNHIQGFYNVRVCLELGSSWNKRVDEAHANVIMWFWMLNAETAYSTQVTTSLNMSITEISFLTIIKMTKTAECYCNVIAPNSIWSVIRLCWRWKNL